MARVKDPVCGMMIEPGGAAGQSSFRDKTYYFCSQQCLRQFEADPARYAESAKPVTADGADKLEQHEPPFTKSGGMVAPKFGSAGSGGAEYERLPEAHDDRDPR